MRKFFLILLMALFLAPGTASAGWNKNPVISHRGAWKNTGNPQNSLASFRDAAKMGCHGSECDVWFTLEDSLVIFHNSTRNGKHIEETPFAELRSEPLPNGEPIPTLREYITEAKKQHGTKLIIDIKTFVKDRPRTVALALAVNALVEKMEAKPWVEYLVGYIPAGTALMEVTDLPVAYLGKWKQDDPDAAPENILPKGFRCVDYQDNQYDLRPDWLPVFKQAGTHLNVWTVNKEEEMARFLDQGFNYITTDEPERLLKLYDSGEWAYLRAPDWFRKGITYQLAPRSMTGAGTLKGAEAHLERLRDLGVNTVYLLPVNAADTDMDPAFWSPRQKGSGFNDPRNPYRAGDYFHVDPEYGTDRDLKDFIDHAHRLDMKVMLDLVFFHCGPGAQVIRQHPEYFQRDKDGNLVLGRWLFPVFDFARQDAREYLKTVMRYYVADFNVDGYRLDVADRIPLDFWEEAREALDELRPGIVMAAEGNRPGNLNYAFDANYGRRVTLWPVGKFMDKSAKGEETDASTIRKEYEKYVATLPKGYLLWNHIENHDSSNECFEDRHEKVWGYERCTIAMAYTFALDGVPFLFNGEEVCFDKRVSIFGHKDCWIDWNAYQDTPRARERVANIKAWASMRKRYSALTDGETVWIDNDCPKEVLSFRRHDGFSQDVIFVGNFSGRKVKVRLADGSRFTLAPWAFVFEPLQK
jgi:glycosidase/glycerophosphoryl diester phosphodiesterase